MLKTHVAGFVKGLLLATVLLITAIASAGSAHAAATYTAHLNAGANGRINYSVVKTANNSTEATGTVAAGTGVNVANIASPGRRLTVTAIANAGYVIDQVYVNAAGLAQGGVIPVPGNVANFTYNFENVGSDKSFFVTFKLLPTRNITATVVTDGAGVGGTISPAGVTAVNIGSNQAYNITPNAGYAIKSLVIDGVSVVVANSYTFFNVQAPHSITVTFVQRHTVTASVAAPGGGTITPAGATTVNHMETISYTVTADATHYVSGITINGVPQVVAPKTVSTTVTLPPVTANVTIVASFAARPLYTINVKCRTYYLDVNGLEQVYSDPHPLSCSGGTYDPASPIQVYEGGSVNFAFTPRPGLNTVYGVSVWGAIAGTTWHPGAFTLVIPNVTENKEVTVSWDYVKFTINATAGPNGSISPAGNLGASGFNDINFTITPAAGYNIQDVVVDGVSAGPVSNYNMTAFQIQSALAHTIHATFTPKIFTITASATAGGAIAPTGVDTVTYGTDVTKHYDITPDATYFTKEVLVDGSSVGAVTSWDFTFSSSSPPGFWTNHTIHAVFEPKNRYKIFVDSGANGTIAPAGAVVAGDTLPSVEVIAADSQTFTITGNAGYDVLDVQVDGMSQGPVSSYTFANVQANHVIKAVFTPAWTIVATAGANGSITPAGTAKVKNGQDKTFLITPNTGYLISNVTIRNVATDTTTSLGAISSYTFTNVTNNWEITALFVSSGSGIGNYCDNPPFIAAAVKPNLLLLLDNSASMYDLAYIDSDNYCFDDTYDDTKPYSGYFDQSLFYEYDLAAGTNKFNIAAGLPATCDYFTPFACVNMAGAAPNRTVTKFIGSGKFLNWLSASKLDVQKQILTGGRYDGVNDVLRGESRGCVGRRFTKSVPSMAGITFAARGPYSYEPDLTNQSTQGGDSRIEIYDGTFQKDACLRAVDDWGDPDVSLGTTQNDTKACLNTPTQDTPTSVFNHMIHTCYRDDYGGGNTNALQNECERLYRLRYANDPSRIINSSAGDAVCSSVLHHPLSNGNTTGFLGICATYDALLDKWTWDDACSAREMEDFCAGVDEYPVTDPSNGKFTVAGSTAAIPAFIVDAGVSSLPVAGTFLVRVAKPVAPTGLVQEFQNSINFGAMSFNYNGSGAECGDATTGIRTCAKYCAVDHSRECYIDTDCPSGSCVEIPKLDGAKIIAYINHDPIGDHDSGIINSIDNIKAISWTPFTEAFYNAIGYFSSPKICSVTNTACAVNGDCPSGETCSRVTGASRTDLRVHAGDFDASKYPSTSKCQKNNILLISDGTSTADMNSSVSGLVDLYSGVSGRNLTGGSATAEVGPVMVSGVVTCPPWGGSRSLDDLAWVAKNLNINTLKKTAPISTVAANPPVDNRDFITTHVVFSGEADPDASGQCNPATLMQQAAVSGGGTYQQSADPNQLQDKLRRAFQGIAVAASSGTAASILSNSEGSGANILQAVFYPRKTFDDGVTNADWIGEIQNLWYYVDPFIGNSTVREDSDYTAANLAANDPHVFNLKNDKVAMFKFNDISKQTMVELWTDTDGDGSGDISAGQTTPEAVNSLWRAGKQLWARSSARTIYTQTSGTLTSFTGLNTGDAGIRGLLNVIDAAEGTRVINYVKGVDDPGYRSRTISIGGVSNVWKLGDIVTSTPRVQSSIKLNAYDTAPPGGYNDTSYQAFVATSSYKNRGMAYVGANDGMLHAFKQGKLDVAATGDVKGTLSGTNLGEEQWAFIPKNALPYLKYLGDKDYRHIFFVDGDTLLVDASIANPTGCGGSYWECGKDFPSGVNPGGTNWKSVLIGSMGLGGASRDKSGACNGGTSDCVKSPIDGGGYSSYFALDVTNQTFDGSGNLAGAPSLMWEFSHPQLGYSTSGPAIVKINTLTAGVPDLTKNGRWFAVFASGPTGPIDGNACQFKGKSDQNLKLFVVDLNATMPFVLGTNYWVIDTGIENAFAGSIANGVVDANRANRQSLGYYQDDALYFGYIKKADDGTWTDGGILRVTTKENMDPTQWVTSKLIDNIGPVVTNVGKLQDRRPNKHNLWLYFGTGRYYYNQDDNGTQRRIFAIKEPCYTSSDTIDPECTTTIGSVALNLTDKTSDNSDTLNELLGKDKGWYIDLEGENTPDAGFGAERVVTDPVAMINGVVYFITFKPTSDPCEFGGKSFMWATKFDTGAPPPSSALQGKALIQLSTGSFEEKNLKDAFTDKGGRRSAQMTGKPPSAPPPIVSKANLKPFKRIIHIQEN